VLLAQRQITSCLQGCAEGSFPRFGEPLLKRQQARELLPECGNVGAASQATFIDQVCEPAEEAIALK